MLHKVKIIIMGEPTHCTRAKIQHNWTIHRPRPECTIHKLCSAHFDTGHNIHRAVLYSVLQYTEARAGSKDGTVSDRLTWGLVSTLSHFDLFTIPFVSEKPSQYSQKTIPQCNVIFVSNTSYKAYLTYIHGNDELYSGFNQTCSDRIHQLPSPA